MRRFLAGFMSGVISVIAVACASLVVIGHVLDVEDPLKRADAIVALSGDTGGRTVTAVDLWPANLTFTNYPARDPQWDPNTWWLHEPARPFTVVELAKLSVEVATALFH